MYYWDFCLGGYPWLFQNCDTLTTRYPPQIGWITGVIPHKMSAITMLYTSKKCVIAFKNKIGVITYMKKEIPLKTDFSTEISKNLTSNFIILTHLGAFDQKLWGFYWIWASMSRKTFFSFKILDFFLESCKGVGALRAQGPCGPQRAPDTPRFSGALGTWERR